MSKKKILWFSGVQFTDEKIKTTGTWLVAMGETLEKSAEIQLYNIAFGDVKSITQKNYRNIIQWIIPFKERLKYHKSSRRLIEFIQGVDAEIKPDLIHIWGTENGFAFAVHDAKLRTPVLLEMQGILFSIVKNYYGGLSANDIFKSTGIKEILRPRFHIASIRRRFKQSGTYEKMIIQEMNHIAVQSDWVDSIIRYVNPICKRYHTKIMLRNEFYSASTWNPQKDNETINIFTASSGAIPYKGLHVILEAIALLVHKYPNIRLNIGGVSINKKYGLIRDGYTSWLLSKAQNLGIEENLNWIGKMSASEMISQMQQSQLVVIPSFVETYCLFMAEAMMVGVPSIASSAGALTELAEPDKSALYFPPGDHWTCARQIERIINDSDLARRISLESRKIAHVRNDPKNVLNTQLSIYDEILNKDDKVFFNNI